MDEEQFHRIGKALADQTRLEILERIGAQTGEVACAALTRALPVTQATIAHHLKELANAGLIKARWEAKFCFYQLQRNVWRDYLAELSRRIPVRAPGA